jgi:hypothetical protein
MVGRSVSSVGSKKSLSIGPEESGSEESIGAGDDVNDSEEIGCCFEESSGGVNGTGEKCFLP